jgi:hypothetical protein
MSTEQYDLEQICVLLTRGFSVSELRVICYKDDFKDFCPEIGEGDAIGDVANKLVDYARRKRLFEELLMWAKEKNPARYREHGPYRKNGEPEGSPPRPGLPASSPPLNKSKSRWPVLAVIAVVLVITIVAAVFGYRQATRPRLSIMEPVEGASVPIKVTVTGTSAHIPKGHKIWVAVFPHENRHYYPETSAAEVSVAGDWISPIYIGEEGNEGESFDILAMFVDENAQDAIEVYVEESQETGWKGLAKLPEGVEIYDRVTVVRR